MKRKHEQQVDVLLVNPPSPDGFIYIRDINRHGRSSWERMIWPQTSLAYLAAVAGQLGLTVDIVDCIAENIFWPQY
jgi:anaerobic magnesium-protoporphyrin IX monomethyl ester cyclase